MACWINLRIKPCLVIALFLSNLVQGQDTVSLKTVEINATKYSLAQLGKRSEVIDTMTKEQFRFNSIAELLNSNSQVYIKSYGPGALASTSFRGGNAAQTAVLWNGFNLQNAMLGQSDLALMPSVLFEHVEIEHGGSSSLWGSGAVGGSIHLNNKVLFGQGFRTATNLGIGSFGYGNLSTSILYSAPRFVSSSKFYLVNSQNKYQYKDTTDKENPLKTQQHAAYNFKGFMQEFKFILNSRQVLSLNAWVNSNTRQLPAYNSSSDSKTYQTDAAMRFSANWSYLRNKFKTTVKGAYFNDKINYTDSLAGIFSKSQSHTVQAENEYFLNWAKHNQFNTGINFSSASAITENYNGRKSISKISMLAGNRFSFSENKISIYVAGRAEYFSVGKLPITGNLSLDYKLIAPILLSANVAKVYRQPTLNELYWSPGGNVNLKPEQGYTCEGNIKYTGKLNKIELILDGSIYSRRINDWILWVPGPGGNPAPLNVQQVWSRGTETSWKLAHANKKWRFGFNFTSAYVLSTVSENKQENNASEGRQLIYTPRYSFNGGATIAYNKTYLSFYNQYTGYRFTASDNSAWLQPYTLSSLRLSHSVSFSDFVFSYYAACNNLFNINYSSIAGRPMPLRNYETGITLKTNHKLKHKS